MTPMEIKNKLSNMSNNLKGKNIIRSFPTIVEDLQYIIDTYDIEIEGTDEERTNNIYDIERNRIDYLAELIRQYMTMKWHKEFKYEIVEGYLFNSTAGYNQRDDIVTISVFGMLVNSDSVADYIKSIAHEFRHQLQYHFLHEEDIEGMLDYPPYFITIAKNMIPKDIEVIQNENGEVIEKPYYNKNYKSLYTEVDANMYGLDVINNMLLDIYSRYPNKNKELANKVNKLQATLYMQGLKTKEGLESENRIDSLYVNEIYTPTPITSRVELEDSFADTLIHTDKVIKDNPIIKEEYQVFGVLMHDYGFKGYWDIVLDKYKAIEKTHQKEKVEKIYANIIKSDPMLTITKYVEEKDIKKIKKFVEDHPTFIYEYKEYLDTLFNRLVAPIEIINLLTVEDEIVKERK